MISINKLHTYIICIPISFIISLAVLYSRAYYISGLSSMQEAGKYDFILHRDLTITLFLASLCSVVVSIALFLRLLITSQKVSKILLYNHCLISFVVIAIYFNILGTLRWLLG